jgi:hypothetical protein
MKHGIGLGSSLHWGLWLLVIGVSACGRSGLLADGSVEEDEQTSRGGSGGFSTHRTAKGKGGTAAGGATMSTSVGGTTAIGLTSPQWSSYRWIVVPTKDAQRNTQLIALRLGPMAVEDRQRLDDPGLASETKYGRFSPSGYFYALTEAKGTEAARATRVVDFSTSPPTIRPLKASTSGRPSQWGPWIDDEQIIAYDAKSPSSTTVENCRIVHVRDGSSEPIEFGIPGASCLGYFERSPKGRRLLAFASLGGARAIFSSHFDSAGTRTWVKVADLKANEALAQAAFNDDESYAVIQKVDTSTSALTNDLIPVRFKDTPVGLAPFVVPAEYLVNFVKVAMGAPRFFVHTTRVYENNRGATPILVVNWESGTAEEVTPKYFMSSSPGFTSGGGGLLTYGYEDETGVHGMAWRDLDNSAPSALQSLGSSSSPYVAGGYLSADGRRFFGIAGRAAVAFEDRTGPIELLRFDFTSELSPAFTVVRLTEVSNVDNWLFTADGKHLIYRAVVAGDVYNHADLLTQGRYASELGTYWVSTDQVWDPVRLPLGWTAFDQFFWLPDSAGLLRLSPDGEPLVVSDAYTNAGTGVGFVSNGKHRLHWLNLDASGGTVTDLTPYLGGEPSDTGQPQVPSTWVHDILP